MLKTPGALIFYFFSILPILHGQVPAIKVDQFGYLPDLEKIAVLSDPVIGYNASESYTPTGNIEVIAVATGTTVFSATPSNWNTGATHVSSGDRAWWFDFSSLNTPGDYYLYDPIQSISSDTFSIDDNCYDTVHELAFKTFYYQRCGVAKQTPFARVGYADSPCHIGAFQDLDCRSIITKDAASALNLSGGWHDAGDYNKYVNFIWGAMIDLLLSYEYQPQAWSDDMDIPESGNYIPDLLDEVKFETDWLLKMQQSNGEVLSIVGVESGGGSPPSADANQRFYGPATTSASYTAASIFALAALQYEKINSPTAQNYAQVLETAAIDAYDWATANPGETFFNTGLVGAGEQEVDAYSRDMRRLSAAIFLFDLTGDNSYKTYSEANYSDVHMIQWGFVYPFENEIQQALLYYSNITGVSTVVANDIQTVFENSVKNTTDNYPAHTNALDPYRAFITDANYVWGSNDVKMTMGNIYQSFVHYAIDPTLDDAFINIQSDYVHYLHGVNPNGLVYLTNVNEFGAANSCNSIYHGWFHDGSSLWDEVGTSTYGPPPGFVPGGPNPTYEWDGCCPNDCGSAQNNALCISQSPPLNQPVQKSYLDWNADWPQNSWQISENGIYYQAAYLQALSAFVDRSLAAIPLSERTIVENGNIYLAETSGNLFLKNELDSLFRIYVNLEGAIQVENVMNNTVLKSQIKNTNLDVSSFGKGIVLKNSNGVNWKISVNNDGQLKSELADVNFSKSVEISTGNLALGAADNVLLLRNIEGYCFAIKINIAGSIICQTIPCN